MSIRKVEIPDEIYLKLVKLKKEDEDLPTLLDRLSSKSNDTSTHENPIHTKKMKQYKTSQVDDILLDDDRKSRRTWKI